MGLIPPRSKRAGLANSRRPWGRHSGLLLALLAGLALRLLLWGRVPRLGLISDEGEYLAAADWLAHGRGFAWYAGYFWTRAPLYPLFVAAHLRLFANSVAPIYATQAALSLLNVALVYLLARRLVGTPPHREALAPAGAALLMALYFPFALYSQVLLSETLFITLLLGAFAALAEWAARGRRAWLIGAGALFGLATLARSLTLPFIPIAALWLFAQKPNAERQEPAHPIARLSIAGLRPYPALIFLLAAALTIAPWTLYNSRLYGGLVLIDTSGAFNILLGGRTAYDGNRNDAATRDFALALLDTTLQPAERARKLIEGLQNLPLHVDNLLAQSAASVTASTGGASQRT